MERSRGRQGRDDGCKAVKACYGRAREEFSSCSACASRSVSEWNAG
jgi:hypothetical protein